MAGEKNHHWLTRPGEIELLIRKSRFLGFAQACANIAEAKEKLAALRRAHPKANHHVYAWRMRAAESGRLTHKYDDDGEPGGTAGRPVLQALETHAVVNAQVVVVRYFGGIKLGAGGLVRAYGETAAKALDQADLQPLIPMRTITVQVPFSHVTTVEHFASREDLTIEERSFTEAACLVVRIPAARVDEIKEKLINLTHGAACIE